ncbi:MAG TPA: multicopper oxidase domain-containing protein [Sulfuricaulis sp.]|nr:multicopper oxidase domain-containing protein [Sulfuricaulis sp.]
MITRRRFLKLTALTGGGVFLYSKLGFPTRAFAAIPGGTLDPATISKYQMPLIIPPAMPRTSKIKIPGGNRNIDYYEIAVRQFQQQILPTGMPPTTVWSYGSVNHPGSFNYPAFTIEAKWRAPVRVKWINDLKDPLTGDYLPHLLPVDPTLHWANPPGGTTGRDMRPTFESTPGRYTGPVPIVTHLHGGHSSQESDGYAEAWYLPAADNIPAGYATDGTWYDTFKAQFQNQTNVTWQPGSAVFQYANDQRAATMWYHDHTLGMTRLNVYAGPAGFYLMRGGPDDKVIGTLPGPAPALGDPPGMKYYEIPIAIQDRAFNTDGSLFYPDSREFFDEFAGPYIPESDISPIWNPEFFGNTMVVNGRTWPYLEVEPRRYRFRLLNGCNARFLILKFSDPALSFWQIGSDGGFLPAPVQLSQLLMSPAERMDVIVDFSVLPPGAEVILQNLGPDEPFGGGEPPDDFDSADPATTGQVMQFRVMPARGVDHTTPPNLLALPAFTPLGPASNTRQVSLNEEDSAVLEDVGPREALLGTLNGGVANPLEWEDTITENPAVGATEVWEIHNFTADAHPIHIHEVQFQIVDRQPFEGDPRPPEANETGFKDTVIAYPGEITRVKAMFDLPGLYVWHCHIVEHEDNEMMRPFFIGPMTP